jgi:hypothetical protein
MVSSTREVHFILLKDIIQTEMEGETDRKVRKSIERGTN